MPNQTTQEERLLTFKEAMGVLRVSRSTLYRLMWAGKLTGHKVGSTWRFYLADLRACVISETDAARDILMDAGPHQDAPSRPKSDKQFVLLNEINSVNREIALRGDILVKCAGLEGYVSLVFYESASGRIKVKLVTYGTQLIGVDDAQWQSILASALMRARSAVSTACSAKAQNDAGMLL